MTRQRNNVEKTYVDPETGRFAKGNPGRPRGSRHKISLAIEGLLSGQAEALGQKAIERALAGDGLALRLCLERLLPARKDSPVEFDLPVINNARDASKIAQGVVQALTQGALTPSEAVIVMKVVEGYLRVLQLSEFEARLNAIEKAVAGDPK